MWRSLPSALLLLIPLAPAWGHEGDPVDWALAARLQAQGRILPLDGLVRKALEMRPGTLLEVEFEHEAGRWTYEVEILSPQGEVWELYFDAASGRLLKQRPERHGDP